MPRSAHAEGSGGAPQLADLADLLWHTADGDAEDARPRLSARLIVDAAIALADAEGLHALSMQRVAAELGYTPMALYRHIPGKAQLISIMTDVATGRPPAVPSPSPTWRIEIESWVEAAWSLYMSHPWMVRVPTLGAPLGPNELAWFEALLSPLARSGLEDAELVPIATFISSSVRDLARVATELDRAQVIRYGEVLAQRLDPERFPVLCSLTGEGGLDDDGDVTPIVHGGLRLLLDGVEGRLSLNSTQDKGEDHG